ENGLDGRTGNAAPVLKTPSRQQQQRLDALATEIKRVEGQLNSPMPDVDAAQGEWEKTATEEAKAAWTVLDPREMKSQGGATMSKLPDKSVVVSGPNPPTDNYTITAEADLPEMTAIRLEALTDKSLPAMGPGRSSNGNIVLTDVRLAVADRVVKFKAASA